MEPPDNNIIHQQPNITNTSTTSHQHYQQQQQSLTLSNASQQSLEKLVRPAAFDKMEALVREMQDPENGVPVRQQKMFLTSIPYAFMGYDLIEWLMDRLCIEESEALNIANQLCLHGYFFPVNDTKTLIVKDDSSLYRFQTPYYWPWQHKAPDNVEYAIYLCKRSLRNKQRHGLEDYETEALTSLHKNLKAKWDFISMQAEEQVRLAKERKKGDKIVGDSQERAYWRVHRPPPGQFTPLEPCPVPSRDRQGNKSKKRTVEDWQREVDYLRKSLGRTRLKMSQVCESLIVYWETFSEYDFFLQPALPSNPWVSEDITFWQLNNAIVDIPTEKRVKRWAISIEELVSDPTGLQEFTTFLEKEYSHENIRFWIAVNKLRRSAHSQISKKVTEIYEEFLKPGAPCEINIDSKTMEAVQNGLKNPSRFTFDVAAEHIYMLLLKKDCYPRFIRSDHYKSLLASGIQPAHKKRFFGFGGVAKKKISTTTSSNQTFVPQTSSSITVPPPGNLTRRRGSDRSLTGSAHELTMICVKDLTAQVPHSHSQSNLSEISYRETAKQIGEKLEPTAETTSTFPWETSEKPVSSKVIESTTNPDKISSTSSNIIEVSERMKRSCGLRQNTIDSDYKSSLLIPHVTEQRRASMTAAPNPRTPHFQMLSGVESMSRASTTPSQIAFTSEELALTPTNSNKPKFSEAAGGITTTEGTETDNDCAKRTSQESFKNNNQTAELTIQEKTEDDRPLETEQSQCQVEQTTSVEVEVENESNEVVAQEEFSPTMEEYQECAQFVSQSDEYEYETDVQQNLAPGCVAPAPTPAPSLAPLAEIEIDPVDEEQECTTTATTETQEVEVVESGEPEPESTKPKRKKASVAKVVADKSELPRQKSDENESRYAVCPWEDEDVDSSDATYVKTYATLGYL